MKVQLGLASFLKIERGSDPSPSALPIVDRRAHRALRPTSAVISQSYFEQGFEAKGHNLHKLQMFHQTSQQNVEVIYV